MKANGTHARDIALRFVELTEGRATPAIMGKTINQAKSILNSGYTKDEIIQVIEYIIQVKHVNMYSLGYVSTSINEMLKESTTYYEAKRIKELQATMKSEVKVDESSAERNKRKADRFGTRVQSGFGKKLDFDMLER